MSLTRSDLESSRLQQIMTQSGLEMHVLTDAELEASIAATLQQHQPGSDLWIFAYGSLIWNPAFTYLDRQVGTIYGWHRRFCLWAPIGRGTPEHPGLVLGLDRGGSCRGIVYRLAATDVRTELLLVWRREMVVGSYIPRWVRVTEGDRIIPAISFVINPTHPCYAHKLSTSIMVHHLATAQGHLGSSADYLIHTTNGLLSAGIQDRRLLQLREQVIATQRSLTSDNWRPKANDRATAKYNWQWQQSVS